MAQGLKSPELSGIQACFSQGFASIFLYVSILPSCVPQFHLQANSVLLLGIPYPKFFMADFSFRSQMLNPQRSLP